MLLLSHQAKFISYRKAHLNWWAFFYFLKNIFAITKNAFIFVADMNKTIKKNSETYTIVNLITGMHYDTNDERFYPDNWERTQDTYLYLKELMENNPEKYKDCGILNNK